MKILDVPYYYQIDNPGGQGFRECCATSNAMLLNSITDGWLDAEAKRLGISQPEQIYLDRLYSDYGDTTDHNANTRCLRSFGVESEWRTDLTNRDYMRSIDNEIAMVLGFEYKDSGHIVIGAGYRPKNLKTGQPWLAYINDPNGQRRNTTNTWISNAPLAGKLDVYSENTFNTVWEGHLGKGWGRLVYSIHGKATRL
jgi:hypothetical protein